MGLLLYNEFIDGFFVRIIFGYFIKMTLLMILSHSCPRISITYFLKFPIDEQLYLSYNIKMRIYSPEKLAGYGLLKHELYPESI